MLDSAVALPVKLMDALYAQGLLPSISQDGEEIEVEVLGAPVGVRWAEGSHLECFVSHPLADHTDPADEAAMMRICNDIMQRSRFVRMFLYQNEGAHLLYTCKVEQVIGPDSDLRTLLQEALEAILEATFAWFEEVEARQVA
ncbi:MAG: YbjN domain-containing protein [Pseudonocardia sp.]|nr:YbjN domain-containing protein [Pseudonocardia sp.]